MTAAEVQRLLETIPDPEIPVISIVELGIVRDVSVEADGKAVVSITPTYSGCPAMMAIEQEIKKTLSSNGCPSVDVRLVYSPVWTTDWIPEKAKEKLRKYGIAPPARSTSDKSVLSLHPKAIACPRCGSLHTVMVSPFGSTACKALYKCEQCLEPFDYFKCH
ncbi:MAG: phenylacetate-CoA oxygenase subunit PaaJ [Bacteroidota bacterium]|jgi:ring-1,2-phenylacetyl-CoA epoxidase subunit PaaD